RRGKATRTRPPKRAAGAAAPEGGAKRCPEGGALRRLAATIEAAGHSASPTPRRQGAALRLARGMRGGRSPPFEGRAAGAGIQGVQRLQSLRGLWDLRGL